jgi:hypothetical protein
MKTNAIITFTGSHLLIGSEENEALKIIHADQWFETFDGQKIKGSAIAEILTIQQYYERYPDKRPVETAKEFTGITGETINSTIYKSDAARKGIMKGLQDYCDENPEAKNAKFMLESIKLNKKIQFV